MTLTVPANSVSEIAFTPSWTNITVGNGTSQGYYTLIGKLVLFRAEIVFGSTSAMGSGPALALPIPASRAPVASQIDVMILDSGTGAFRGNVDPATPTTTSVGTLLVHSANGTYVGVAQMSSTIPMTWTTNDRLQVTGWYMAA